MTSLDANDALGLTRCLQGGGVAVFPTDTVYGLGCHPDDEEAVRRLYALKGRPADRPAAVMFFEREPALETLSELSRAERVAVEALLPGPATVLLPNRNRRFPLAGSLDTLGLRVPSLPGPLSALSSVGTAVLQSSANLSGEAEARRLDDVPASLLDGADLVLDGGELPGVASTVVDLRDYERSGSWRVLREGPLALDAVERALMLAS
jgi:L-threonylcarbamoyladenylate synthase